eukprot:s456_g11.t1
MQGTEFAHLIGKGQAKNLFFKVPSGGGALKNRLFLVCALVETAVDNKTLSTRLGIKASSPLRLASDDIFDDVLQIPKGSVNPFVLAQESCSEIFLLLDKQFLSCEGLLFHPMSSDFTTCLAPTELTSFLEKAAPGRFLYVDLASSDKIDVPPLKTVAKAAPKETSKAPAKDAPKEMSKTPAKDAPKETLKAPARDAPKIAKESSASPAQGAPQDPGAWYWTYQTAMGWAASAPLPLFSASGAPARSSPNASLRFQFPSSSSASRQVTTSSPVATSLMMSPRCALPHDGASTSSGGYASVQTPAYDGRSLRLGTGGGGSLIAQSVPVPPPSWATGVSTPGPGSSVQTTVIRSAPATEVSKQASDGVRAAQPAISSLIPFLLVADGGLQLKAGDLGPGAPSNQPGCLAKNNRGATKPKKLASLLQSDVSPRYQRTGTKQVRQQRLAKPLPNQAKKTQDSETDRNACTRRLLGGCQRRPTGVHLLGVGRTSKCSI